jgi:hypothetical protein
MRRTSIGVLTTLLVLSAALAAESPHYKKNGQPVCTINTTTGTASCTAGLVTGLGNDDIRVTVSFGARADTFCHNPGNSLIVPGQNPTNVLASTTLDIDGSAVKNGNATIPAITVVAVVPVPSSAAAGCPNGNWSVTLGPIAYGAGRYTFEQPPGTVIEALSFTF